MGTTTFASAPKLGYTSHDRYGNSEIMEYGGTPEELIVGHSKRTRNKHATLGSTRPYLYRITNLAGQCVYSGSSMAEGLERLATWLRLSPTHWMPLPRSPI